MNVGVGFQQQIGEAESRVDGFTLARYQVFRYGVKGTMNHGMAIDQDQYFAFSLCLTGVRSLNSWREMLVRLIGAICLFACSAVIYIPFFCLCQNPVMPIYPT